MQLQSRMAEKLRFIQNQDGMLFTGLVQTDDGFRDLSREIAAIMRRLQIQTTGNLAQQVQR